MSHSFEIKKNKINKKQLTTTNTYFFKKMTYCISVTKSNVET